MSDPMPASLDARTRYPWRVKCSGCGWVDHFDTQETAQEWADQHNAETTSWPHDATVSPRD